ncbi:aminotransferase class I/II-fold pyridoxal phosphate-dependent enzyme [Robiginitalea marina]|uniref:Pyridoxal phosphate-dependent aminotransferase family protein n=1 Tax=Robiginitalea marina TaxID=2954105 RepID=A0ABT1AWS3_9FLAO|nr:pyridoxal phosphate-dependent aminotransferase family protein [Robiginitalea marina]MCO5724495.1 pyridoxal phosphate-dependent aminotransferase family protein [Robiginitalea marina]
MEARLEKRLREGAFRQLYPPNDRVDFSSNDYLGYAHSPRQPESSLPPGSTGSRLISGNHGLYSQAEKVIAEFHRADSALIYNSGYDANVGLLSCLLQRNDCIFYDQSVHASIRDGIALGKGRAFKFSHNSLSSLKKKVGAVLPMGRKNGIEVYVITESVFSMEGDGPDLAAFSSYCREMGFHLIVDEAHAAGILGPGGRGEVVAQGCEDAVFARVITFGKALGCHGAAVLGSHRLREYQINFSRSLIYTTALPPGSLQALLRSYQWLESPAGKEAREQLRQVCTVFRDTVAALGLGPFFRMARGPIHCCEAGGNMRVKALALILQEAGFEVKPILSPTVDAGRECLRFSLHAFNTATQVREVLTILGHALKKESHGE